MLAISSSGWPISLMRLSAERIWLASWLMMSGEPAERFVDVVGRGNDRAGLAGHHVAVPGVVGRRLVARRETRAATESFRPQRPENDVQRFGFDSDADRRSRLKTTVGMLRQERMFQHDTWIPP